MASVPPLIMKLAMTVSPHPTFPRKREKGQTNRCASFTLTGALNTSGQKQRYHPAPQVNPGLLYFDKSLVRRHAVALFDMNADHDAAHGRLDFVFHFHGFDDQYAIPGFDLVPDLDLDIDNGPGHGGGKDPLLGWARASSTRRGGGMFFLAISISGVNL